MKRWRAGLLVVGTTMVMALGTGCASNRQTKFESPDEAVQALETAIRSDDRAAIKKMFGSKADELINSGDAVSDAQRKQRFVRAWNEGHRLETDDGQATLVIGKEDWPLPVPIVEGDSGKWYFDTEAGLDEVLNRRIGQNELDVIKVCEAIVDAQQEYAQRDPDGLGIPHYARKFFSDEGKRDGLYWPTKEGEAESPLGPGLARATAEGYTKKDEPQPFHGYYYRILEEQGPHATGGELNYLYNGKLIGGFGVVAYPATYGNSGVVTFIVDHEGVVYQKDLGEETARRAKAMKAFDPGPGWERVDPGAATQPTAKVP